MAVGGDAVVERDLGEVALNGLVGIGRFAADIELVALDGFGNADRLVELGLVLGVASLPGTLIMAELALRRSSAILTASAGEATRLANSTWRPDR
jgi:hypothetical protein